MGAWGTGPFENDEACDWAYELEEGGVTYVSDALSAIAKAKPTDYADAHDCCNAIAAAEVVAAMHGKGLKKLPEDVEAWISTKPKPNPSLKALAATALDRIGSNSELKELWDEGGSDSEHTKAWYAHLADLKARLQ
jgi:hypothetical protein